MAITLDPNFKGDAMTLSDGNMSVTQTAGHYNFVRATEGKKGGKWYWECRQTNSGTRTGFGFVSEEVLDTNNIGYFFYDSGASGTNTIGTGIEIGGWGGLGWTEDVASKFPRYTGNRCISFAYMPEFGTETIIGVALDLDNNTVEFYKDGVSLGICADKLPDKKYYSGIAIDSVYGGDSSGTINLGATPFKYPIPDGFKPYDSSDLPEPPVDKDVTLLRVVMIDSSQRDYQLGDTEIDAFVKWYMQYKSTDDIAYCLAKKVGTQKSNEYLTFDKIISFEVIKI